MLLKLNGYLEKIYKLSEFCYVRNLFYSLVFYLLLKLLRVLYSLTGWYSDEVV